MPELPEVEIARRQLQRWATGQKLRDIRVLDPAAIRFKRSTRPSDAHPDGVSALRKAVVGRVADVPIRRGKRLGWTFGGGAAGVQIHLGMTGQWMRRPSEAEPPRFSKLGFELESTVLWFADSRRFGCVVPESEVASSLGEGLGPDAWLERLDGAKLGARLRGKRAIKVALLDQAVLAGIGNIHAAEALWRAGIAPETRAGSLSPRQLRGLAEALFLQLDEAITSQDTDEFVYVTQGGDNPFAVYGKAGEPCPRCGQAIVQDRHGGRSTFWCSACQPPSA